MSFVLLLSKLIFAFFIGLKLKKKGLNLVYYLMRFNRILYPKYEIFIHNESTEDEEELLLYRTGDESYNVSIPDEIYNLSKYEQVNTFAQNYEQLLFSDINPLQKPNYLGGSMVLAIKNYKQCLNKSFKSPLELGFIRISTEDENNLYNLILNRKIKILSCKGTLTVTMVIENLCEGDIYVNISKGQVFEQKSPYTNEQNLSVNGWDTEHKLHEFDEPQHFNKMNGYLQAWLPPGRRKLRIRCWCIDKNSSQPNGTTVDITPWKDLASVSATSQNDVWEKQLIDDENSLN